MKIKGTARYMPPPGERPGDPVDGEIQRGYEKRFGEPASKVWGERRLINVDAAREWLGYQPQHVLRIGLVKEGELPLVKIGSRSFVQVKELDDFVGIKALRRRRPQLSCPDSEEQR